MYLVFTGGAAICMQKITRQGLPKRTAPGYGYAETFTLGILEPSGTKDFGYILISMILTSRRLPRSVLI